MQELLEYEQKFILPSNFVQRFCFSPVAFETLGVVGSESLQFLKDLGRRIHRATDNPKSYIYLLRRLSISIQRGNSASVLGTIHCFFGCFFSCVICYLTLFFSLHLSVSTLFLALQIVLLKFLILTF